MAPAQLTANGTYIVQEGDSLSIIAQKLNVKTDDLIAINGLQDAKVIYIGQELKVPGQAQAPVADTTQQPDRRHAGQLHGQFGQDAYRRGRRHDFRHRSQVQRCSQRPCTR